MTAIPSYGILVVQPNVDAFVQGQPTACLAVAWHTAGGHQTYAQRGKEVATGAL